MLDRLCAKCNGRPYHYCIGEDLVARQACIDIGPDLDDSSRRAKKWGHYQHWCGMRSSANGWHPSLAPWLHVGAGFRKLSVVAAGLSQSRAAAQHQNQTPPPRAEQ